MMPVNAKEQESILRPPTRPIKFVVTRFLNA